MVRILLYSLAFVALMGAAACGDDASDSDDALDTTTTDAAPTSSSSTSSSTSTSTTSSSTSTTSVPADPTSRCENPEGFSVVPPDGWVTNDGDVVEPCSQWNPEPFEVPDGTDERVAAITAYVDPVQYADAVSPEATAGTTDGDRAVTAVQGRQAVRLSYEADGDGFYPEGTPITLYAIDVAGSNGEPATLFFDTVGTAPFDYDANVETLDRMMRTLELSMAGVETTPDTVATYLGGGGGFSVVAEHDDGQTCLRIPPNGEPVCTEDPASDQVHTIALQDLREQLLAGVTGAEVWRVDAIRLDETVQSHLAVPVPGSDLGGFAFTFGLDELETLVLLDIEGDEVRRVTPGG